MRSEEIWRINQLYRGFRCAEFEKQPRNDHVCHGELQQPANPRIRKDQFPAYLILMQDQARSFEANGPRGSLVRSVFSPNRPKIQFVETEAGVDR